MKRKPKFNKKILPWVFVILWMGFIFYQSHKPAPESNRVSKDVTEIIVEIVERVNPDANISASNLNHILRKNAHFFGYMVLGILTSIGLRIIGVKGYRAIAFAFLICILFAVSDEFHQTFIQGRGGQVSDVIIDCAGALVGIGLNMAYWRHFPTKI